jgi:spermidine/putrescine transport system permease protein
MTGTLESRSALWLLGLFSIGVYIFQLAPIVVVMLLSFNASRSGAFPMEGVSLQWYGKLFANESIL